MSKTLSASDSETCNACQKLIVGEGCRCTQCGKLSHLSCTGLPSYALACMLVTVRTYMCPGCVATKKNNNINYEDALRKIELLLSNEATAAGLAAGTRVGVRTGEHRVDGVSDRAATPADVEDSEAGGAGGGRDPVNGQLSSHQNQNGQDPLPLHDGSSSVPSGGEIVRSDSERGEIVSSQQPRNPRTVSSRTENQNQNENSRVCRDFIKKRCPHGKSGRMGGKCRFEHPRLCHKFLRGGNSRAGCDMGSGCNFYHPKLCWHFSKRGSCSRANCSFYHQKGNTKPNVREVAYSGHLNSYAQGTTGGSSNSTASKSVSNTMSAGIDSNMRDTPSPYMHASSTSNGDFLVLQNQMQSQLQQMQQQMQQLMQMVLGREGKSEVVRHSPCQCSKPSW